MPGWQILNGHVELLSNRNVPMIPGKVTHSTAQEGVGSTKKKNRLSRSSIKYLNIKKRKNSALVLIPVELLLDDGCQFLVKSLQVSKAHQKRVALWTDQLLCITQILQLAIAVLKPEK